MRSAALPERHWRERSDQKAASSERRREANNRTIGLANGKHGLADARDPLPPFFVSIGNVIEFKFEKIAPRTYNVQLPAVTIGEYGFLVPDQVAQYSRRRRSCAAPTALGGC